MWKAVISREVFRFGRVWMCSHLSYWKHHNLHWHKSTPYIHASIHLSCEYLGVLDINRENAMGCTVCEFLSRSCADSTELIHCVGFGCL